MEVAQTSQPPGNRGGAAESSSAVIKLTKVRKAYRTRNRPGNLVLNDLDLTVRRGEFIVIRGESGSGKTTLLKIVGLLDQEFEGSHVLDGRPVHGLPGWQVDELRSDFFGYVFQEGRFLDHLSVKENIVLPLRLRNADETMVQERYTTFDGRICSKRLR